MLIEKLIRIIKRDRNYQWQTKIEKQDLFIILISRFLQLSRGLFFRLFFKRSKGYFFVGSSVKIKHCRNISVGINFILEDGCYVNALSVDGINIGDNVSIGRSSTLVCSGVIAHLGTGISIGNNTGINSGAYLGGQGGIQIGSNVIIGPGVKIFSENHNFEDTNIPIRDQGVTRKGVKIGNDCWLGANSIILDGVNLGSGCVIAAGAIVTKSFPSNCVVGGVPAKILKYRK